LTIKLGTVKIRKAIIVKGGRRHESLEVTIPKRVLYILPGILGREADVFVDEKRKRIIYQFIKKGRHGSMPLQKKV